MGIQFFEGRLTFPEVTGRVNTMGYAHPFNGKIAEAHAVLRGYEVNFDNGDHHVLQTQVALTCQVDRSNAANDTVHVNGTLLLRDSSGNIDDPYRGWIDYLIIAQS
jgi:hypothetical protein